MGRMSKAGNLRTILETFSKLPRAWWREKRARAALKRKTEIMLASRVPPSLGHRGGQYNHNWHHDDLISEMHVAPWIFSMGVVVVYLWPIRGLLVAN